MAALTELHMIAHALRKACYSRWTDDSILDHVTVKLPAPIFDALEREARHAMAITKADSALDCGTIGSVEWFKFEGIKYERLDGVYWSVSASDGKAST